VTVWPAALAVGVIVAAIAAGMAARRRAAAREARRVEELGRLAERLERSLGELRPRAPRPPEGETLAAPDRRAPLVAERLPGRAALLEAVAADVERARSGRARLTAVLVRAADGTAPADLADAVRSVTGRRAYAVGPSAAAFTLPGCGRADGLGALARIEAATRAAGHAVEWSPDETAVELVARLLEPAPARES
jgi:hypothetical protein